MIAYQSLAALLDYSRPEILDGQWWRLLSGHLVHLNGPHWIANLVAGVLIARLIPRWPGVRQLLGVVVALGLLNGTLLFLLWPYVDWYMGLSGVLHGLLVWIGGSRRDGLGLGILSLLLAKLVIEQVFVTGPWIATSIVVLPEGHQAGALAGIVILLLAYLFNNAIPACQVVIPCSSCRKTETQEPGIATHAGKLQFMYSSMNPSQNSTSGVTTNGLRRNCACQRNLAQSQMRNVLLPARSATRRVGFSNFDGETGSNNEKRTG